MDRIHEWELEDERDEPPAAAPPAAPLPRELSVPAVLALQRAIGNRAVGGMLMRGRTRRDKGKKERAFRKARVKSRYSGLKSFKSQRLRKIHGSGTPSGPQEPRVTDNGERLWDGKRPAFRPTTYTNVLANKGAPQHNAVKNRTEYRCSKCKAFFPRLQDAVGDEPTIDLDHTTDWDTHVTMTVDMTVFPGPDGHRWRAYLYSDVVDAYNDEDNLVPMCSTHNRSKSGPKTIDRVQRPEHVANCVQCVADALSEDDDDEFDDEDESGGEMDTGGAGGAGVTA